MARYRVKDWSTHFEKNRTRELKRMEWVAVPNRMDGRGYTALVDHPNAAGHLGAWLAILEIASRSTTRGEIPQDGAGNTETCLARISRLPVQIFMEVLPRLVDIGWIECFHIDGVSPHLPAEIPHRPAESAHYRVGNGREGKGIVSPHASAEESRKNAVVEAIIRGLANQQPDPQDFESGIDAAVREIMSSANPEVTVTTMQANLPLWWAAMRDGRARTKPMRFVIVDRDYLRVPKSGKKEKPLAGAPGPKRQENAISLDDYRAMLIEGGETPEEVDRLIEEQKRLQ